MDTTLLSDDERRARARKNYQKKGTHEQLREMNDVLYNAGFSFMVQDAGPDFLDVDGSFDLSYYVQLKLSFHNLFYSDLKEKDMWPDAWYEDQLIILTGENRARIELLIEKSIPAQALIFQFTGLRDRRGEGGGIVVADALEYEFLT